MSVWLAGCLAVWLSGCLAVWLSVWLSGCLSVCQSVRLSVCLSVCLSVGLSVCVSVCLSVCMFVWLRVCIDTIGFRVFVRVCLLLVVSQLSRERTLQQRPFRAELLNAQGLDSIYFTSINHWFSIGTTMRSCLSQTGPGWWFQLEINENMMEI